MINRHTYTTNQLKYRLASTCMPSNIYHSSCYTHVLQSLYHLIEIQHPSLGNVHTSHIIPDSSRVCVIIYEVIAEAHQLHSLIDEQWVIH